MTQTDNILDAPTPTELKDSRTYKWLRGIAVAIEIFLWLIAGLALLFKMESWEGGSELFILSFTMLSMFYLALSFLVTGARGRQQVLGAFGVGFSLCLLLLSVLFIIESWEGGREMQILGLVFGGITLIGTVVFLLRAKQGGKMVRFYWNALVRLGVVFLIVL